jgi:hypothetical protein
MESWAIARVCYFKYLKDPKKKVNKYLITIIPKNIEIFNQGSWITVKDYWFNGEKIEGFFIFSGVYIGYNQDIEVLQYMSRRNKSIDICVLRLEFGVWCIIRLD